MVLCGRIVCRVVIVFGGIILVGKNFRIDVFVLSVLNVFVGENILGY